MKSLFRSVFGVFLLSGCASVPVVQAPVKPPNPVPALVAGRPIVYRTGCAERFRVDAAEMAEFSVIFPGQKAEDSAFQAFVRPGFDGRIASMARLGRIQQDPIACDSTRKIPGVGFSAEGTRLLLDTANLDTGKVYLARSPVVFVLADSATRTGFFGKAVPEAVKLVDVEMSYGLYDPRTRRTIATGALRGLSSTGSVSEPDVVRDDWYNAPKRLVGSLERALDTLLTPDTAARR